jgi:hypothetical protein
MICVPSLLICLTLATTVTVQDDPLAMKASFRSWAVDLAQNSLTSVYPMLHPPVLVEWDKTNLYSDDELLLIKSTFDEELALKEVQTVAGDEKDNPAQTVLTCAFLQENWSKSLALRIKLSHSGEQGYYIAMFPIGGKRFEPSAINEVSMKSAQALVQSWHSFAISEKGGISYPQINSGQQGMTSSDGYYESVLAADISRSLPFVLSDAGDSAQLSGNISCAFKNIKKPRRRCNEIALNLNLTDAAGNPLWSGRFIAESEESNINARLRYLEDRIATNQSQALIIGGLGLPLTTAGVVIWYQNYQARMNKLNEGAIPGSLTSSNLTFGEYAGIAMSAVGGAGLIYAVQAAITALNLEGEHEKILQANTTAP